MSQRKNGTKIALLILAGIWIFAWVHIPHIQAAQTPENPSEQPSQVSIDFNGVDISVFIKFISNLTGQNFVVDPRVKGKVTIVSPEKP